MKTLVSLALTFVIFIYCALQDLKAYGRHHAIR